MAQKMIVLKGIPSSGKSTFAKQEVAKDPINTVRICKDDIRLLLNGKRFTIELESMVHAMYIEMIRIALNNEKNVICDCCHINNKDFTELLSLAKSVHKDIDVIELPFYVSLEEAIARDERREAKVGEDVIRKFWIRSGGEKFKNAEQRIVEVRVNDYRANDELSKLKQDTNLPRAVVFDNDGTISLLNGRNPYDASTADNDLPHEHVIECMRLYHNAGYKILFVSGREEKAREPTERFYKKHFPEVKYELFMRPTGNQEKDFLIKERIYKEHILNKYYLVGWFDDRLQVCKWVYEAGLPLFRVNDPCSIF
jgi:predicted kinase